MINVHMVAGRLGTDPDMRELPSGQKVANFSVGSTRTWYDKSTSEKKEATEWTRCAAFGKNAENIGKYFRKGDGIIVVGRTETRDYMKDGVKMYATSTIVDSWEFPPCRKQGQDNLSPDPGHGAGVKVTNTAAENHAAAMEDDDIPF